MYLNNLTFDLYPIIYIYLSIDVPLSEREFSNEKEDIFVVGPSVCESQRSQD